MTRRTAVVTGASRGIGKASAIALAQKGFDVAITARTLKEGDFSPEQERILLAAYFGHDPDPFDVGRMVMYKAMCDLLWTLWGVIQHANQNPADDFWAYAVGRLQRCRTLMATDAFSAHLAAVENGPGS